MDESTDRGLLTELTVEQAAGVIRKQLGRRLPASQPIDAETVIDGLGVSSLMMTEIFFAIEELVGRELDSEAATTARTVGDLVAVVNGTTVVTGIGVTAEAG